MTQPIAFNPVVAELSMMASDLRHLYLNEEAARIEGLVVKLEALHRERDAAQVALARVRLVLENHSQAPIHPYGVGYCTALQAVRAALAPAEAAQNVG